jgi:hypothetical protein
MICTTRTRKHGDPRNEPFGIPSPARIRQLAAKIRRTWSPRTRSRRAAQGFKGIESMVISALEFGATQTFCDG